jgi:hypothetical protein
LLAYFSVVVRNDVAWVRVDADNSHDRDAEAGLLFDFAYRRVGEVLAHIHLTAGQSPPAVVRTPDE